MQAVVATTPIETETQRISTSVGEASEDRQEMHRLYWQDIIPLRGGTKAMRGEQARLLPYREREEREQWDRRKEATFLDPYYDDAIVQAAARPFAKPVTIREEESLPPELAMLPKNVDRRGTEITIFAHKAYDDGLDFGMHHIFVDFPAPMSADPLTSEEERLLQVRPVFLHVTPPDLLGAEFTFLPNGEEIMSSCRIKDDYRRPDYASGEWASETVERVRVFRAPLPSSGRKNDLKVYARFREQEIRYDDFVALDGIPGTVETWEKGPKDKQYVHTGNGPFMFPGIPLFTYYTGYVSRLCAKPFFWKIAELNIAHWQFSSVHHSYVDVVQVGGWTRKGGAFSSGAKEPIEFGHKRVIDLPADETLEPLEHKGTAYAAGKDYKMRLENRMKELSTQIFLENRPADITATGDLIRDAKNQSTMQQQIRSLENLLENCFRAAGTWLNVNRPSQATAPILLPEGFAVDIASDQPLGVFSAQETEALRQDVQAGYISEETYLRERKRRGGYPDDFDPEEEARKAAAERMARVPNVPSEIEYEEPDVREAA